MVREMRPVWQEKSGRNTKGRESEGTKKTRGQASEKIKCATTYLTLQVSRQSIYKDRQRHRKTDEQLLEKIHRGTRGRETMHRCHERAKHTRVQTDQNQTK